MVDSDLTFHQSEGGCVRAAERLIAFPRAVFVCVLEEGWSCLPASNRNRLMVGSFPGSIAWA